MIVSGRQVARNRAASLLQLKPTQSRNFTFVVSNSFVLQAPTARARLLLFQAGLSFHPLTLYTTCFLSACVLSFALSKVLTFYLLPLFFVGGALLPFNWCKQRARKRASEFLSDYPSVLLATASSLKVGMTAYAALERSVNLLPPGSVVRLEVEHLISQLRRGVPKEQAVTQFASSIDLPDLELFRSAFILVLEQGGRFSPTLERLASVAKDRTTLIDGAKVSTTNMRMTANILLAIAPLIVMLLAARTPDYWEKFIEHPVANTIASLGIGVIAVSYTVLRSMSSFKP